MVMMRKRSPRTRSTRRHQRVGFSSGNGVNDTNVLVVLAQQEELAAAVELARVLGDAYMEKWELVRRDSALEKYEALLGFIAEYGVEDVGDRRLCRQDCIRG